jgi:hypothetical protein
MISSATDESDEDEGRDDTSIQESVRGRSITRLVAVVMVFGAGTGRGAGQGGEWTAVLTISWQARHRRSAHCLRYVG